MYQPDKQTDQNTQDNAYFDESKQKMNTTFNSRSSQSKILVSSCNTGSQTPGQKKNSNVIRDSTTGINCLKKLA